MENEILALTLAQMMALNRNLAQVKNSSSLTFLSINFLLIRCNVTISLKIVNY